MRITYLGHASVLIEINGLVALTDPVLRSRIGHLRRIAPPVRSELLERVDLVLVSHAHHDHLDVPSLKLLPNAPEVICPPAAERPVGWAGLQASIVRAGVHLERGSVSIKAVPADHDGRRWPTSRDGGSLGYVLRAGNESVYFAGDTGLFDEMTEISDIEVALLPVAGWGPRLGPGHLDPDEAARAAAMIQPRIAVPIHWGSYRPLTMRQREPADAPALRFAARLEQLAPGVSAKILQVGDALDLGSVEDN